jgi:hypothetical protein
MARKNAKATGSIARDPITVEEIPLRRPDRNAPRDPNRKTLIDLIEEHHPSVRIKGNSSGRIEELPDSPTRSSSGDGDNEETDDDDDEEEEDGELEEYYYSPAAAATYLAVPLSILMFGLDILCHQQYSQEPVYRDIFFKCLRGFPV